MNPTDGDRRSSYTPSYALLHPSITAARPRNRVLKSVKRRPFWGGSPGRHQVLRPANKSLRSHLHAAYISCYESGGEALKFEVSCILGANRV